MSYQGQSPKVNRLRLNPRSSDPTNAVDGDLFYADGSDVARPEGLYVYRNSAWHSVLDSEAPIAAKLSLTPSAPPSSPTVGTLYYSNGSASAAGLWAYSSSGWLKVQAAKLIQNYTSNGSFTVPAGVTVLDIEMIGGGGGGAGGSTASGGGGGGGGGAGIYRKFTLPVTPGLILTVTIGTGGSAGGPGGAGGDGNPTTITGTGVNLSVDGGGGGQCVNASYQVTATSAFIGPGGSGGQGSGPGSHGGLGVSGVHVGEGGYGGSGLSRGGYGIPTANSGDGGQGGNTGNSGVAGATGFVRIVY